MNLSVIIINYNTFKLTSNCLRSIRERSVSGIEKEVILVDNGSVECDPELFLREFPGLILIKSDNNLGFSKANNLGIRRATGEYILLLNSDSELKNDAISKAYERMREDDQIGVLSGKLLYENGKPQPVAGKFPGIGRELHDLFRLSRFRNYYQRSRYYLGTEADYERELDADWIWGAFFMFRKKDLEKFPDGKLQDDFFMYFEDVQWCYYFKKVLNKRILYSPLPEVFHYIGGSDKASSPPDKYFEKIIPNEYRWMEKVKGTLYTKLYYLVKAIHYYSLRNPVDSKKASKFFDLFLKGV